MVLGDREAEESDWVENLWHAIPAPKARVEVTDPDRTADALDRGLTELAHGQLRGPAETSDHDHGAAAGHGEQPEADEHAEHGGHEADGDHGGHDMHTGHETHDEHDGHDMHRAHDGHDMHGGDEAHGDHDMHGGHDPHGGHHGHAGHDMGGLVDGLPMADRADDRDGLRLDRLHVPLGPALADWPAGLILRMALQGDVVQEVTVETVAVPPSPRPPSWGFRAFWDEPWLRTAAGERVSKGDAARRLCAAHLDSLGRFFAVAGWADMAARTRYVRDRALAGADAAELTPLVRPLIRRAGRSWTLRRLTTGLGVLRTGQARHAGVTGPALVADGDAHSRMLMWLDAVGRSAAACDETETLDLDGAEAIGPRGRVDGPVPPSQALLDVLPGLLEGTEFACARIIVASLDPDPDELAHVPAAGMLHG